LIVMRRLGAERNQTTMTNAEVSTTSNDANVAQTGATVAPPESAPKKAATSKKGAPKGQNTAQASKDGKKSTGNRATTANQRAEKVGARQGSKTAKVLELLKRRGGATMKELTKVTGWQPHSVRGFLSGTLSKKMGLAVMSTKNEDGERRYTVKK
jgi:hypothetical protein